MAHASRSIYHTAFGLGLLKNVYLWAATIVCLGLLVLVVYVGPLQDAFHTEPFGLREWLAVGGFGCVPFLVIEAFKISPWRIRPPGPSNLHASTAAEAPETGLRVAKA
jgi:magnesium-transporting ATPase (P-type)